MKEDLKRKPINLKTSNLDYESWMYEGVNGLEVIMRQKNGRTSSFVKIHLTTIRAYLRRLDKGRE